MKRNFRIITGIFLVLFVSAGIATSTEYDSLQTKPGTISSLKLLPLPKDNRNYFFLQAIGNDTIIVIGDFTTMDKRLVYILDKNADNTIDAVVDYYPEYKRMFVRKTSASKFFNSDIAQLKRDIISGKVFEGNFTDHMYTLKELDVLVRNWDEAAIGHDVYGFNVNYYDIDNTNKVAGLFSYGKRPTGYYLQFITYFYKVRVVGEEYPKIHYAVYCKDTNDPVVKETVENLFKYRKPISEMTK